MKTIVLALASTCVLGCIDDSDSLPEMTPAEQDSKPPKICGDNTVAETVTPEGNRITFCVDNGAEVIAEVGRGIPVEHEPDTCALDVFLALTDATTPVPARLVDACAARLGHTISVEREVVDRFVVATPEVMQLAPINAVSYCGVDGESQFGTTECFDTRRPPHDGDWPYNDLYGTWCKPLTATYQTHTQYISQVLGEQGNYARDTVASCNGATRLRGLRDRGAADPAYVLLVDMDVPTNQTGYLSIQYTPSNGEDAFFQLRGDSYGAAWHRYAGYFEDSK